MEYKKVKLIGKDEDGFYEGRIELIGTGRPLIIFGKTIWKEKGDTLYISNRKTNFGWINLYHFFQYRQIGTFKVNYPNQYKEMQDIVVKKVNDKIVEIVS